MFTWVQAYSILVAALASDKATTNEESVGLVALFLWPKPPPKQRSISVPWLTSGPV